MTQPKSTSIRRECNKIFPEKRLEEIARETGVIQRQSKVKIVDLFWTLVLGFEGYDFFLLFSGFVLYDVDMVLSAFSKVLKKFPKTLLMFTGSDNFFSNTDFAHWKNHSNIKVTVR